VVGEGENVCPLRALCFLALAPSAARSRIPLQPTHSVPAQRNQIYLQSRKVTHPRHHLARVMQTTTCHHHMACSTSLDRPGRPPSRLSLGGITIFPPLFTPDRTAPRLGGTPVQSTRPEMRHTSGSYIISTSTRRHSPSQVDASRRKKSPRSVTRAASRPPPRPALGSSLPPANQAQSIPLISAGDPRPDQIDHQCGAISPWGRRNQGRGS
jgi:hypothetical protein